MQIDSTFIKAERQKRGWSQEHLAAVTGLGVRTIQRLESSGAASNESAQSLAAVFEVPLTRVLTAKPRSTSLRTRLAAAAAAASLALVSCLFLMSRANADGVALHVVVGSEISGISSMNIEGDDGQQMQIELANDLRLVLTPTLQKDDLVLVSIDLYHWDGTGYQLVSKPSVLTRKGLEAKLRAGLANGKAVTIDITPNARARDTRT